MQFSISHIKHKNLFADFLSLGFLEENARIRDKSATSLIRLIELPQPLGTHINKRSSPFFYKIRGYQFEDSLAMIDLSDARKTACHIQQWLQMYFSLEDQYKFAKLCWDKNIHNLGIARKTFNIESNGNIQSVQFWKIRYPNLQTEELIQFTLPFRSKNSEGVIASLPNKIYANNYDYSNLMSRYNISESEAKSRVQKNFESSKNSQYFSKNYWLNLGYQEADAIEECAKIQRENSAKFHKKYSKEEQRKFNRLCREYYEELGMSSDVIDAILSHNGYTFSLELCVEKYGKDLGISVWKNRQEKWQQTLVSLPNYAEIQKKKDSVSIEYALKTANGDQFAAAEIRKKRLDQILGNSSKFYSKESVDYLAPIAELCQELDLEFFWKEKEFFLHSEEQLYFYDFTIPELRTIIEYNGKAWHPREEELDFKTPRGALYDKCIEKERKKIQLAENNGFDVIIVWQDKLPPINFIMEKIYEKRETYIKETI